MRIVLLLCLAFGLNATEFPEAQISNGQIKAKLYLPDAQKGYYQATRFDWSGVISSLEYQGHNYFGVWFPKYDPKIHDAITGPVEEFRTGESGLGYEEAKVGDTFIRIGVGLLKKPEEPRFQQFKTYDIVDNGKWTVHTKPDSVEFIHEVTDKSSGYGYHYRKVVKLEKGKPQMTIEHSLKNTGTKPIETNVYNHGFFVIDGQPSGPDFSVTFPFEPQATQDLHGLAETRGKTLTYLKELEAPRQSVFTEVKGYSEKVSDFDIRIENKKVGAGVRIQADKPLWKINFWSIRSTVCPEPFVNMKIEPGKTSTWKLTYDFYTLPAK